MGDVVQLVGRPAARRHAERGRDHTLGGDRTARAGQVPVSGWRGGAAVAGAAPAATGGTPAGETPPGDDQTPDPATLADRSRITVEDHVEPGVLLTVSGAHLRVETPLHHCELVQDQGVLITLPLR